MIISGRSQEEISKIKALLDEYQVRYDQMMDPNVLASNNRKLNEPLNHLSGARISEDFHAIEILSDFEALDSSLKTELLKLGVTDEIPKEFEDRDFSLKASDDISKQQAGCHRSAIGSLEKNLLYISAFLGGLYFLLRYLSR